MRVNVELFYGDESKRMVTVEVPDGLTGQDFERAVGKAVNDADVEDNWTLWRCHTIEPS